MSTASMIERHRTWVYCLENLDRPLLVISCFQELTEQTFEYFLQRFERLSKITLWPSQRKRLDQMQDLFFQFALEKGWEW